MALPILICVAVVAFPHVSATQVTVTGRVVVGETGRSLEGAAVILEPKPGTEGEARQAVTDDGGRFRWEEVGPGEYFVRVQAEGYPERTRDVSIADEDVHLALSVISTLEFRGQILRPDGEPLANYKVALTVFVQPAGSSRSRGETDDVKTDAEGRFRLRTTRFGRWRLKTLVSGVGYGATEPFAVEAGEEPEEVTLQLGPFGAVSGRVVARDGGDPISEARVTCHPRAGQSLGLNAPRATCGPDGQFTALDVFPGPYLLSASADGYRAGKCEVTVGESEHVEGVLLELPPALTIRIQVLRPDGKTPATKAKVGRWDHTLKDTDGEGRATLELQSPGRYKLIAVEEGYAPAIQSFEIAEQEQAPEIRLVLKGRGGTITGTVRDADRNQPLSAVAVAALQPEEYEIGSVPHIVGYNLEHFNAMGMSRDSPFRTETDANGVYELTHIPEGVYVVAAVRERGLNLWKEGIRVREGETTADVDLEVRREMPGVLRVRVMLPDGKPLANTAVRSSLAGPGSSGGARGSTDEEGYLRVRLRNPGKYAIQVIRDGYYPATAELQIEDVKSSPEITLTLEPFPPGGPPTGSISGQVFMPDGTTPAKGIWVAPFTRGAFFPGANRSSDTGSNALRMHTGLGMQTEEDGLFTIHDLPPGKYSVYASTVEFIAPHLIKVPPEFDHVLPAASDPVEVKDGEVTRGVRIVLGEGGSVLATVTNAHTGTPIAGIHVSCGREVRCERIPFHDTYPYDGTDDAGQVRLVELVPCTYTVRAWARGYKHLNRHDVVVEAGKETKVQLKLEPAAE